MFEWGMRWAGQGIDVDDGALPGLQRIGLIRSVRTPQFDGITFHEVLRRELRRPSWTRETVALGTNTDPYQRAEGRYAQMPGIIGALTDFETPFSILTKGTLLRRDLPMLSEAARRVDVSVAVSLAVGDPEVHNQVELGTPTPQARLQLIEAIRVSRIADAGATSVTVFGLHLRGSTRGWFMDWLARTYPEFVAEYRQLYRRGAYLPG